MKSQKKPVSKRRVLLLHTGGTIGMGLPLPISPEPGRSGSPALKPDQSFTKHLKSRVPELWMLAKVEIQPFANKDSSQITPQDWSRLAEIITHYQDDYDAFVVTHGTDTMVYTGTALSYLLPYPCKPVVITGSQRPLADIRSDARRNLISSVGVAASQWICEVTMFFDTVLLRANRAKKIHIEEFHAFGSPNFPLLGEERLKPLLHKPERESLNRPSLEPKFNSQIQVVKAYPGASVALMPKAKAVVIEAFGCGNLPIGDLGGSDSILSLLKTCQRKKIPVVLASQVPAGAVLPEIYEMGRKALELGAIPTRDMTFEATIVKCMMLAGNNVAYGDWPAGILSNWAGELTPPPKL